MLRSGLALWAYTAPTNAYPLVISEYSEQVEALEFSTVAPGGFGDLACVLKLPDARLPRPELQLFSRLCLRDGYFTCFGGEWSDPALVLDDAAGEYVHLSAIGGGTGLRDDPADAAYAAAYAAATTAQAIVANEFASRAAYLTLDPDQSAVLPTAPASTFTPVYDGYNLEEILHDLASALGVPLSIMLTAWPCRHARISSAQRPASLGGPAHQETPRTKDQGGRELLREGMTRSCALLLEAVGRPGGEPAMGAQRDYTRLPSDGALHWSIALEHRQEH